MMRVFGGRPAFQLTGLIASLDGLYDRSFVVACARWWNHEIGARKRLRSAGHRQFAWEDVQALCEVVQPDSRGAFEAKASEIAMPGRQSMAVLGLGYAFALVTDAGAGQVRPRDESEASWTRARAFEGRDLVELERHYSAEGADREYDQWAPFWASAPGAFADGVGSKLISAARAVFNDQVDRWGVAEGFDLRLSVGEPDWSLAQVDENPSLPTFVDLLFEWGGRLRLGERLLAEGYEWEQLRFCRDESDHMDHLYEQARERYLELASQTNPIDDDIDLAVRIGIDWLGDARPQPERIAMSTCAIRGYLWRTVERGAVSSLEPELSEAVERSRTVGDDRSPDEPWGVALYYAASQCMAEKVDTRLGSIGGFVTGPRTYEMALHDTTSDFVHHGLEADEDSLRLAFQFGVCLADAERVLSETRRS
jgi:hypothetical protein